MADRKLRVVIVGDASSLEKELSKAGRSTDGFGKKMGGLQKAAGVAGLAIGGGLAVAAKIGFDELKQGQLVAAQTEAVLKSTGGVANVTADDIDNLASSLLSKSGVDDEAIASGANLLLTFKDIRNEAGKGNDVFDQTTKAALDMSVAMGTDMRSAALTLGKALNDPSKGLTKLTKQGVTFTDAQKEQIKALQASGKTMEAQKIILAELNSEFGGSAEAAGKTLAGQLNIAKETFSNLAAEIVTALLPAMNAFAKVTNQVVGFLTEHKTIAKLVVGALGTLAVVLGTIAVAAKVHAAAVALSTAATVGWSIATKAATVAQLALNLALTANPIGIVVVALAALTAGLILAWRNSETFRAVVTGAFDAVTGATRTLTASFEAVLGFFRSNWREIATLLTGPFAPLVALATDAFGIRSAMIGAFEAILAAADRFGQLLVELVKWPLNQLIASWNQLGIPSFSVSIPVPGLPDINFGTPAINFPDIPFLAKGGIVTRPTLAMIGERGPEAVIPLGRGRGMGTTVEVHQHFQTPPTTDGHREARYARVAAQAAFDGGL